MKPVGVIGSGKFGTTIAKLLSTNVEVIVSTRRDSVLENINEKHTHLGLQLNDNIRATKDFKELAETCDLIFPVVPSAYFRSMLKNLSPHLHPKHILIHGTKGLDIGDVDLNEVKAGNFNLLPKHVRTMTQLILEETVVLRVGCLSGPNLSAEIMAGEPAATVIASKFNEVVDLGKKALHSDLFRVYGSSDLLGAEWGGVLKNVYAIASGLISGLGFGYNLRAVLITRSISEMVRLGSLMGSNKRAFFGMSGIGDMIATASVNKSRNFTVGERFAKGETLEQILNSMTEPAEGLRTVTMARDLSRHFGLHLPIVETVFSILYEGMDTQEALVYLMNYPYTDDVDFM